MPKAVLQRNMNFILPAKCLKTFRKTPTNRVAHPFSQRKGGVSRVVAREAFAFAVAFLVVIPEGDLLLFCLCLQVPRAW